MNVERFRRLVATHLGLVFEDAKLPQLVQLLEKRVREVGLGEDAYLARLARGDAAEVDALAEALTVGETYFFRNREQLAAFVQVALAERLKANGGARVRILSAACSTGEEPYTLAMLASEVGVEVTIRAVDLNPAAIRRAVAGKYTPWSMRDTSPERKRRWFKVHGKEHVIDEQVRRQVRFEQRNLTAPDADLWAPSTYDIVFFRNALMYWAPETARAVVARIERALVPGGYLFLGHAETLRGQAEHSFELCHTHETFYYRRPDDTQAIDAAWPEAISRATERVRELAHEQIAASVEVPPPPPDDRWREALTLLAREELDAAVACLAGNHGRDAQLVRAVVQLQRGNLDDVEALLATHPPDAAAHYVLALAAEVRGDLDGAVTHHTAATHLDATFAMPHLQLGLLSRRAHDRAAAKRALAHALALLADEPEDRIVLFGGGFKRDALLALCRGELARVEAA